MEKSIYIYSNAAFTLIDRSFDRRTLQICPPFISVFICFCDEIARAHQEFSGGKNFSQGGFDYPHQLILTSLGLLLQREFFNLNIVLYNLLEWTSKVTKDVLDLTQQFAFQFNERGAMNLFQ